MQELQRFYFLIKRRKTEHRTPNPMVAANQGVGEHKPRIE
jgi:hypothetical protein